MQLLALCNRKVHSFEALRPLTKTEGSEKSSPLEFQGALSQKIFLTMRLTGILLLTAALHVSASTKSQTITFSGQNVPLQKVFEVVKAQTGYVFFYNESLLSDSKPVSLNAQSEPLEDFLKEVFRDQQLKFVIENKTIIIGRKTTPQTPSSQANFSESMPPIEIHGHITDSLGNPLAGASVTVKGGKRGTSTDANGDFVLHGIDDKATLIISFTGYVSKDVRVNGANSISITLIHSNSPLDNVEIIAYGTTTQRFATGNVNTVTSKEIEEQPVVNALGAMEGRVPGLYITQSGGIPGSGYTVQIRGQNSIASGNSPLYIVDGMQYSPSQEGFISSVNNLSVNLDFLNPLNFLNPLDIESISVLKDADATAIYGSRGANGVILITTKKGKAGKTKIDFNIYTGTEKVAHFMKLLNTQQYVTMREEALSNDGLAPTLQNAPDLLSYDTSKYTDWQKTLIGGTAYVTNAQVSVSGGNENTHFLLSGNYHQESTVYGGDFSSNRSSVNFSFDHQSIDQKFKINFSANYLINNSNLPGSDLTNAALTLPPNSPNFKDPGGNLIFPPFAPYNPYTDLLIQYFTNSDNLISSATVGYRILPELNAQINFGYGKTEVNEITINPVSAINPAYGITTGNSLFGNTSLQNWIVEPQIKWGHSYGLNNLSALVGGTIQQSNNQGNTISANGYTNDALLKDLGSAGSINNYSEISSEYRYDAIFARINDNLNEKYILNLTARRDGSSRFGPGKQFSNFGAIGAAWIFSNESYIKHEFTFLSFGKLRSSYGLTGNDQIPDYGYVSLWTPTQYPYQNVPGLYPANLANPNYSWEKNKKFEVAIDLGFLKDRILTSVSWYQNRSDNQLLPYSVPPSVGYTSVQANLPATIQNTGLEIVLNTVNVKGKKFEWTTSFNISIPSNKILSYPNIANSPYATVYTVGKSIYDSKYFHFTGIDPATGLSTFEDYDHNGNSLDIPGDLQSIKKIGQDYFGGLQNSLSYAGFHLTFLFQFVKQTAASQINNLGWGVPGSMSNQPTDVLNRWRQPGDNAEFQKFTTGSGNGFPVYLNWFYDAIAGDNNVVDASFIRLKNVSISYTLPSKFIHQMKLNELSLFIQGQNIFTITGFKGLDPQNPYFGHLPSLRTLIAGIKITL
jgi:TonB-dependent starch-binding outer membrane protein SusC